MRILVTGASGYLGGYVINELIKQGHEVISTSRTRPKKIQGTWIRYMIIEKPNENLYELFEKPDLLIHCAWSGIPNYTEFSQLENFFPQYDFIKNLVRNGLKDVTVLGTCLEYGKMDGELKEDYNGYDLTYYATAKMRLYEVLKLLPISLKWCRLFHNFGVGSIFYSLIKHKQDVVDIVDETQYRDYLPVETVAKHIVKIATQSEVDGIINVCSGKSTKIVNLAKFINPNVKLNVGNFPNNDFEGDNYFGSVEKLNKII